jgi:putative ATP-binding cassette transporter
MQLLALVFKRRVRIFIMLVLLGLSAGGIHVWLLVMINKTLNGLIEGKEADLAFFLSALGLLLVYLVINRVLSGITIRFSQQIVHDIRMQLIRSALRSGYHDMKEKQELLYAAVTKDVLAVSHAALSSIVLVTAIVTVAGSLVYLAYLSFTVLIFIALVACCGVGIYTLGSHTNLKYLQNARESEDVLFHHIRQVIDGFREVKINPSKGEALVEGPLQEASLHNYKNASKGFTGYYNNNLISQFLFYVALIALLFLGGTWLKIPAAVLMNCIIVTLYLLGPLESVAGLMPDLGAGNIAAIRLDDLLRSFGEHEKPVQAQVLPPLQDLTYQSVCFKYPVSDTAFSLGPIDFELKKGEVVFIYGGNGAGKTTLLHIVLGLLQAQEGKLFLNGEEIVSGEIPNTLFAPVFSDFHLFDRLYGIDVIDRERANRYLQLFELEDKISIGADRFSSLKLSTGQRKRLAFIAILLENRPILLLDEWAADQDPAFRTKFYMKIIPILKAEGFTILAITHDDKYYERADSLYRMESGALIKEK